MGVERFDVLLRDAISGATIIREWSRAEMLRSVSWLKRMNARGNNIYVRPSGEHGLALLDSLKAENLASMRSKGFAPAVSIQETDNEFQAWVKLSDRALPERLRRLAEAGLMSAFGGKVDNVVCDGYGRLAGCASYVGAPEGGHENGKYVLAHAGRIEIAKQARDYVEHVKKTLEGIAKKQERKDQAQRLPDTATPRSRGR